MHAVGVSGAFSCVLFISEKKAGLKSDASCCGLYTRRGCSRAAADLEFQVYGQLPAENVLPLRQKTEMQRETTVSSSPCEERNRQRGLLTFLLLALPLPRLLLLLLLLLQFLLLLLLLLLLVGFGVLLASCCTIVFILIREINTTEEAPR